MITIIVIITAIAAVSLGFFLGWQLGRKSEQIKEYWRGRGEGWQACEDMVMERAVENQIHDKDGLKMNRDEIWETLVQ